MTLTYPSLHFFFEIEHKFTDSSLLASMATKKTYIFRYFCSSSLLTDGLVSSTAYKRSSIVTTSSDSNILLQRFWKEPDKRLWSNKKCNETSTLFYTCSIEHKIGLRISFATIIGINRISYDEDFWTKNEINVQKLQKNASLDQIELDKVGNTDATTTRFLFWFEQSKCKRQTQKSSLLRPLSVAIKRYSLFHSFLFPCFLAFSFSLLYQCIESKSEIDFQ